MALARSFRCLFPFSSCKLDGVDPHVAFWLLSHSGSLQSLFFVAVRFCLPALPSTIVLSLFLVGDVLATQPFVMLALLSSFALSANQWGGVAAGFVNVSVGSADAGVFHGPVCAQPKSCW